MPRSRQRGSRRTAKHEALVPALDGKVPVFFAAHRADDIQTALRIAKEFKLKPVIALGTEGYRMMDELKKARVPVVVHPTMQRAGGSMETLTLLHRQRGCSRRRRHPGHHRHRLRGVRAEDARAAPRGGDGRRRGHGQGACATGDHARRGEAPGHREGVRQHRAGEGRGPGAVRRRPVRAHHARHAHASWTGRWSTTAPTT